MNPNWTLARTSSQNGQAVTLDEAKSHLRVSGNDQDEYIELLIDASTEKFERDINRGVLAATWLQSMYAFPEKGEPIELMMGMNTGVSSVQYIDTDGNLQDLSSSLWSYSQGRGVVFNAKPRPPVAHHGCTDDQ